MAVEMTLTYDHITLGKPHKNVHCFVDLGGDDRQIVGHGYVQPYGAPGDKVALTGFPLYAPGPTANHKRYWIIQVDPQSAIVSTKWQDDAVPLPDRDKADQPLLVVTTQLVEA